MALKDGLFMPLTWVDLMLLLNLTLWLFVDLLRSNKASNVFLSPIVDKYSCLLRRFQQHELHHIFRKANRCAYLLTKAVCWFCFLCNSTGACTRCFKFCCIKLCILVNEISVTTKKKKILSNPWPKPMDKSNSAVRREMVW